ncbi:MAG: hypothetical protein HC884_05290 [Chloroflexaceae bacterium]|nr:hypothetical protein [Chloroflexaceae bacterium]
MAPIPLIPYHRDTPGPLCFFPSIPSGFVSLVSFAWFASSAALACFACPARLNFVRPDVR